MLIHKWRRVAVLQYNLIGKNMWGLDLACGSSSDDHCLSTSSSFDDDDANNETDDGNNDDG